jgi:cobalt/nickel transport system permease protein
MHMADALLSPAVGGTMWTAAAAATVYCSIKVRQSLDDRKVPLMGVLAAFVFAAQMINFTIPGTGSSGHLGGGLILAILMGPHAAFLAIASVLTVQSLFFADGGLLALGCNIFNLGVFPCFIAYPLIYRKIVGNRTTRGRLLAGSVIAAIVGLQLGAFGVVMETTLSGIVELPFSTFVLMMQPIHLAIGIVEGLVTAGVVSFIWKARPEILEKAEGARPLGSLAIGRVLVALALATVLIGGVLSWYASEKPDGLEWSILKISGKEKLEAPAGLHRSLEEIQQNTAALPDYGFKKPKADDQSSPGPGRLGTSAAGLLGGFIVLLLGMGLGLILKKRSASHA